MAFVFPDLTAVICISQYCLRYWYALLLIPILIILHYFFIRKNFITFYNKEDQNRYNRGKAMQRMTFFLLRSAVLIFLIIAIASPFLLESKSIKGNPRITLLVDQSQSMDVLAPGVADDLVSALKGKLPVTVHRIGTDNQSAVGQGIINHLDRDENVVLVSDGQVTTGPLLGDVAVLAQNFNATISEILIDEAQSDARVSLRGPNEAILDTTEVYFADVQVVGEGISYTIEVLFDGQVVLKDQGTETKTYTFNKKLSEGYHKIEARFTEISGDDHFAQNNEYFMTTKVVDRPRVLFVSEKASPLRSEFEKIYDLEARTAIPNDLSPYLAVILNDIPMSSMRSDVNALSDYVSDGNGLFVIGGPSAYDNGGYQGTLLETLLPARIGSGEDEGDKSDVSIVTVIDTSHGTEEYVSINKAQAVSVIDSLDEAHSVGAIAFNSVAYRVEDVDVLDNNKDALIGKISRLIFDGQSRFDLGVEAAHDLLRSAPGAKNIILITDGKTTYTKLMDDTKEAVRQAANRGIKTYVVGVGNNRNDEFLTELAQTGNGIYFPIDASNRLEILFGETDDKAQENQFNTLAILDSTHFITFNQSLDVIVNGYNYMVPKPAARLLVSSNKKIPILAAWRFGLGRVVSLATDDGSAWAGELVNGENSRVLTRSVNWAIGDLTRTKSFDVRIVDTTIDRDIIVDVVSNTVPEHDTLQFVKTDISKYSARTNPTKTGFHNYLGADVAVNYADEFKDLGLSSELSSIVDATGGEHFTPDQIDEIIEFAKEHSKRITIKTQELKWPFIIVTIILYLIDVAIRRKWEYSQHMK